jgi:hypothetical protein
MARNTDPSFILELPLNGDKRDFAVALDAASHIGNAVLGEGRRLDLMHESRAYGRRERYGEANREPQMQGTSRRVRELLEAFGVTGRALQKLGQGCPDNCWIKDDFPGHVAQTTAKRGFNAVLQYALASAGELGCQVEAIKSRTKYCHIVRREMRDRERWHVQLIHEGLTRRRNPKTGVVGLDIGPGNIGAVAQTEAIFE